MPDYSDDAILSAIERFKKGEETKSDRKIIAHALDSKHIEIAPAEDSKIIEQTGGTNFGQENEIRISGDVTQIVGGFTFEQALEIAKLQEEGGDNKSKIIVALIGAGGLIIAAIITGLFGSGFFSRVTPTPTPTNTPTPTETSPPIIPTETTPPPTSTETTPLPTPTDTHTPTPTFAPGADFLAGCIHSNIWKPYKLQVQSNIWQPLSPEIDSRGCMDLSPWGFFTKDGGLQISLRETVDNTQVGFYKQLDSDAEIIFDLLIDQITTRDNLDSILMFGIIPDLPADPDEGRFLHFFVGGGSMVIMQDEPGVVNRQWLSPEHFGKEYKVTLSLEENKLNMIVDGVPAPKEMILPNNLFNERAFWIGYHLWSDSTIDAFISNFDLDEN